MPNLTSVTITAGVPTAGTGTVSTLDQVLAQGVPISDGTATNIAAIKAASTAAIATDKALVVAVSPNNTVPVSLASVPSHAVTNAGTFAVQAAITAASGALASGSIADGAQVTLGTKADAANVATDTTAITAMQVWKQISKTLQAVAGAAATALFSKITDGTNTAAVKAASTAPVATDPALVVAISPNSVNANGRALPAASAPVVLNSMTYSAKAASSTAALFGATGASGDYLDGVLIIPATAAAGVVSITDGGGSAITIFAGGGTTALPTLAPFYVPIGAISSGGAGGWKVTTGTNVSVIGIGNFT